MSLKCHTTSKKMHKINKKNDKISILKSVYFFFCLVQLKVRKKTKSGREGEKDIHVRVKENGW